MSKIIITPRYQHPGYSVVTLRPDGMWAVLNAPDLATAQRFADQLITSKDDEIIVETRLTWPLYVEERQ